MAKLSNQSKPRNWLNIKQLNVRHDKSARTRAVTDLHIINALHWREIKEKRVMKRQAKSVGVKRA